MKIEKVRPLDVSFNQLPEFARAGRKVRKKFGDVIFCKPNKININPQLLIDAGISHVDLNPGQSPSGLTYGKSAVCAGAPDISQAFAANNTNLNVISYADCEKVARSLVAAVCGTGCEQMTSQMEEAPEHMRTQGICLGHDLRASTTVEYFIGKVQAEKGGRYFGQYDGFGRADILNRVSLSDLQNPNTILAFLRFSPQPGQEGVNTAGGGNKAFLPHTLLNGVQVRGAAEYRDILYSSYAQGWFEPDREVATTAFQAMLGRNGLVAMADEVNESARKAAILSRRVMNFMWSQSAQIGNNEHVLQRFKVDGLEGVVQAAFFMPNPVGCQRAVTLVGLFEDPTCYDWEDTTMYGTDPMVQLGYTNSGERAGTMGSIEGKVGRLNGQDNGYTGANNVQLGINVYRYTPDLGSIKLGYPDRCLGNQDISYSALDAYGAMRGFTGMTERPAYLSVKGTGENAYCDTTEYTYTKKRFDAKKGWGYVYYNPVAKRAAVAYQCFHLEPGQTEQPWVKIGTMEIQLPEVCGGESHEFLIEW